MPKLFTCISHSIGDTPLVRLNRITQGSKAVVYAKLEAQNPTGSIKCRVAASMIWDAEKKGLLVIGNSDVNVIEATSGNTGIGLAFMCALKGYPLIIAMPETMSIERQRIIGSYGAKIVLTDGSKGLQGSIDKVSELIAKDPPHYFCPQQFSNPANPQIHFETTGPEINEATNGKTDIIVSSVGSGGTITGIAKYFKKYKHKNTCMVAVEPASSAVLTAIKTKKPAKIGPHKIQGIGAGFKPDVLDLDLVDEVIAITDDEAFEYTKRMHKEEGISCGISSGAAVCAADKIARRPENEGKNIIVILPDSGERYLSTGLFD